DVTDAQRDDARRQRCELVVVRVRSHHGKRDVARLELEPILVRRVRVQRKAEQLPIEVLRLADVFDGHADGVHPLDVDQPTDPSICSWMSLFISTAYSSGSSFVIGSTKPETISADASASDSPRDIK